MAKQFFKKMASAFVEFKDEETNPTIVPKASTAVITATDQEPKVVVIPPEPHTSGIALDKDLLNKLCEELESVNLPGPDYQELKTAASDEEMVELVPDETKRFVLAYKTLKAAHPDLNKLHILHSIDVYVNHLKKCEKDALEDINKKRQEIASQVERVTELKNLITQYQSEIEKLQSHIDTTKSECGANEAKMVSHVAFLVEKLNKDKETINQVIKEKIDISK